MNIPTIFLPNEHPAADMYKHIPTRPFLPCEGHGEDVAAHTTLISRSPATNTHAKPEYGFASWISRCVYVVVGRDIQNPGMNSVG